MSILTIPFKKQIPNNIRAVVSCIWWWHNREFPYIKVQQENSQKNVSHVIFNLDSTICRHIRVSPFPPSCPWPPPHLYIHSVFMPVDNKEHGSIHAGGGVTGNSWQLFKYLLSVSRSLFSLSLSLLFASRLWSPVEEAEGGEGRGWGGSGVWLGLVPQSLIHFPLRTHQGDRI